MTTINSNTFGIDRKNKKNIQKLYSIIDDYEYKLDNKVNDLVSHMINYSRKIQDEIGQINKNYQNQQQQKNNKSNSFALPIINQPKSAINYTKSQSRTLSYINGNSNNNKRDRSISSSFQMRSTADENMQQRMNMMKNSVANSMAKTHQNQIIPLGRSLGNKKIVKPKFVKKKLDILPKQIRDDPFTQKNIIKAHQLDKGIISLIERGKIGKDVDIITAFQKGGNILNARQAVFHDGQQKLTRNNPIKVNNTQQKKYSNMSKNYILYQKTINTKINYEQNNWAITMPDNELATNFDNKNEVKNKIQDMFLKDVIYFKFLHFNIVKNQDYNKFTILNSQVLSQINNLVNQISKLLQKYTLQIVYVDSNKILQLTTLTRKVNESQIISLILSFKNQSRIPFQQIVNIKQRKNLAIKKIQGIYKRNICRKQFLLYLKKKKVQVRIYNWVYNAKIRRNFKQSIKNYKNEVQQNFKLLQQNFKRNYNDIVNKKHYEIHISNKPNLDKESYKEYLNTQITRIFNFSNPNTHILIILSQNLNEQTKNYYFKIMELEQIPNFKDRVTFMNVRNYSQFSSNKFSCSQKLYYDSKLIRDVKSKIGHSPAYFRISYPSKIDISMSSFFNIPIYTGDLCKILQIEQRSNSFFKLPQINSFKIQPNKLNPINLVTQLIRFYQKNQKSKNYIIKINGCYQSTGVGLLTYPFQSLPGMYSNTAFITNSHLNNPSQFYRKLCKKGGIVQIFEESISSLMLLGKINSQNQAQLIGTYDKVSYGFVNVGYFFPQITVSQTQILQIFNSVSQKLIQIGYFGDFQISLFVDDKHNIYFDKIQCYQTQIGSSLFYFKFLCDGKLNNKGQYMTEIVETFQAANQHKEEQVVTVQPRSYFYLPYILHFGLSQKQTTSFFQLCRIGGISFDLQNKFGSTFILLGSLKNSMGLITTAKNRDTCKQLMIKSLNFIIKQNSHNNSNAFLMEREKRMKQRQNILVLKQRIQNI